MMRKASILLGLGAVAAFMMLNACSDDSGGNATETKCSDHVDNDGDGKTDCMDSDCANAAACQAQHETICNDGQDNDGDNRTDCADPDCATDPACSNPTTETNCSDNVDNDNDNLTDCSDPDCANDPACQGGRETNCSDNIDNDNDSMTDCADADCANDPACQGGGGELSCMGIIYCLNCCNQQDRACLQACMGAGTQNAQTALDALGTCQRQNCGTECSGNDNQACQTCMEQHCQSEMDACTWDTNGQGGCLALLQCLNGCQQDPILDGSGSAQTCPDRNGNPGLFCYQDCMHQTSQAGFDAAVDLSECIQQAEGQGGQCETQCSDPNSQDCAACIQTACANELANCQNT